MVEQAYEGRGIACCGHVYSVAQSLITVPCLYFEARTDTAVGAEARRMFAETLDYRF